jgi:hypothetical protein
MAPLRRTRTDVELGECQEKGAPAMGVSGLGSRAVPLCPIRIGEPCSLCVPGVSGPEDCGLVQLVMSDPDLREQLREKRLEQRGLGQPAL